MVLLTATKLIQSTLTQVIHDSTLTLTLTPNIMIAQGVFQVTLTVNNTNGYSKSTTIEVVTNNEPPKVHIVAPVNGYFFDTVIEIINIKLNNNNQIVIGRDRHSYWKCDGRRRSKFARSLECNIST
jgi:hypothetical protein